MFKTNTLSERLQEIEENLLIALNAKKRMGEKCGNLPTRYHNQDFNNKLNEVPYINFIQGGDYHYFVSRVLFLNHVEIYSFYAAQQCVECYLKGYMRLKEKPVIRTHNLESLLKKCREIDPLNEFLNAPTIDAIIMKYNSFNEYPRYPISLFGPGDFFAFIYPDDILWLDYFIFKMREFIKIPSNFPDIFRDHHFRLLQTQESKPNFYNTFKKENINFLK